MSSAPWTSTSRLPRLLGLAAVALHLPFLDGYGYHGDELYFLSCGARPAFGYVDHAPLVPWIAALARHLGDGPWALRLVACLAGGLTVALTARLARVLGGDRRAMALAALAVAMAPFFLRTASLFAIPSFEPVWWVLAALLLVRIVGIDGGGGGGDGSDAASPPEPRAWLPFGVVAGVGLLTKHTILLWGFAIVVGLLLTQQRRVFATRWPWLGAGIALLLVMPNLLWQATNGWPTVDFAVDLNRTTMARIGRGDFVLGQVLYAGPVGAAVWLPGAVFLLRRPGAPRVLGLAFATVLAVLLVVQSKIYYSMPAYPVAFAGGAVLWSRLLRTALPRVLLATAVGAAGLLLAPISVPALPIAQVDRLAAVVACGLADVAHEVTGDLHGMFGWPEFANGLAAAHAALPPDEQARALVLVPTYAMAGALERFAPGLPPVLCNHMSWHFWTRDLLAHRDTGDAVVLACGHARADLDRWFADVREVAVIDGDPRAPARLRQRPVFVCRNARTPLAESWPRRPSL